jgi:hypothetical protein
VIGGLVVTAIAAIAGAALYWWLGMAALFLGIASGLVSDAAPGYGLAATGALAGTAGGLAAAAGAWLGLSLHGSRPARLAVGITLGWMLAGSLLWVLLPGLAAYHAVGLGSASMAVVAAVMRSGAPRPPPPRPAVHTP